MIRDPIEEVCVQETVFNDGEHHFATLLDDIQSAIHSIDLEAYAFHNDVVGQRVAEALIQAAKRGVCVRVMVDGVGSPSWGSNFAETLERSGIETRIFHPFPWQLWNWRRSMVRFPLLLKWMYLLFKINFRNHRKVCMIDNKLAYIGSFNIAQRHLHKDKGGNSWRDTSVRLCAMDLSDLSQAFNVAWNHDHIKEGLRDIFQQIRKGSPIRLNYTRHRRRILYKNLLQKISHCRQRIWVTNAYFVPDNRLLKRLKDAAASGVDVRILLPKKSDIIVMPWAASTFYYSLLKVGARIFEYWPSMLHAKTLILDDWMLVGSSNLNHRSLLHDLEVDVTIRSVEAKSMLVCHFLQDLSLSYEISLTTWKTLRSRMQRIMGYLVLYLKYWM